MSEAHSKLRRLDVRCSISPSAAKDAGLSASTATDDDGTLLSDAGPAVFSTLDSTTFLAGEGDSSLLLKSNSRSVLSEEVKLHGFESDSPLVVRLSGRLLQPPPVVMPRQRVRSGFPSPHTASLQCAEVVQL